MQISMVNDILNWIRLQISQVQYFDDLLKWIQHYQPWMKTEHLTAVIIIGILLQVIISVGAIILYARKRTISKPTNLQISNITFESVTLEWNKPDQGAEYVTSYTILCRSAGEGKDEWESKATCTREKVVVNGLQPRVKYVFKVRPERNGTQYKESDVSETVKTKPKFPGKPETKPLATQLKQSSITLKWGKPEYGEDLVVRYVVHYRVTKKPPKEWEKKVFEGNACTAVIDGLNPDTKHEFKVVPEGELGCACESEVSDSIRTNKVLAIRMKEQSTRSNRSEYPVRYTLPMTKDGESRYIIGDSSVYSPTDQKVLMLMGATGAGKTTLINGIVNYYLNISVDHDFRFELAEKVRITQAHSQTSEVIAYTFYPMDGSRIPYVLTIIDTPGFADTRGMKQDRKTLRQINDFLSIGEKYGIDHFNGVGVVVQAALPRLTSTQKYIFDSVLSVLAKDVETNMFLVITFADSQRPQVLSAVEQAEMPYCNCFKFNNSALFANPKNDILTRAFWDLGMNSFDEFFDQFGTIKEVSIEGSRTVLMDREQLQTIIEELQKKIAFGLESIDILNLEKKRLADFKSDMDLNENFTNVRTTTKHQRKNIPKSQKALNCRQCFSTCHYPCELQDDEGVRSCAVIKCSVCTICPLQCSWESHELQGFIYEYIREKIQVESTVLKSQFEDAKAKHDITSKVVTKLEEDLSKTREEVVHMIVQARECKQRLNEMALRPKALTTADYIDVLIQSEKSEKKKGYQKRIETLEGLKKANELHKMLSTEEGIDAVGNNVLAARPQ